jgi:hypothetical protein
MRNSKIIYIVVLGVVYVIYELIHEMIGTLHRAVYQIERNDALLEDIEWNKIVPKSEKD